jgi:hypothetical protein
LIRIIDHKRVDLTNDEYNAYRAICRAYDDTKANRKGEDLFVDHFEVNGEGIITFVKPPHQRYSSLEVYCFLVSIMVNQHLRVNRDVCLAMVTEAQEKLGPLVQELTALRDELKQLQPAKPSESSVESSKASATS